ncbi:hypothetical protein [Streptacidiphilus sp. EB129]|uniref:hypothetical protein n=1 Tax=Streptacidiphilus sp. EB129 TaxID=3156262 RepID=UPI0035151D05
MMKGSDRRTAAACPCLAARNSLYTAVRVVDPDGRVLALVRPHGHPLGLVTATGTPGDLAGRRGAPVDASCRGLCLPTRVSATPPVPGRRIGGTGPAAILSGRALERMRARATTGGQVP